MVWDLGNAQRPSPRCLLSGSIGIYRVCSIMSVLFIFDLHLPCLSDDPIFYIVGREDRSFAAEVLCFDFDDRSVRFALRLECN